LKSLETKKARKTIENQEKPLEIIIKHRKSGTQQKSRLRFQVCYRWFWVFFNYLWWLFV